MDLKFLKSSGDLVCDVLLDRSFFARRPFTLGVAVGALAMFSIMALLLYFNLYAQSRLGLDMDEAFLDYARRSAPANVELRRGDAYETDLPAAACDPVHMRFVASTAGNPERLLKEATRLARPGRIVALQEPDASALHCYPPHPAGDRLEAVLIGTFKGVGADLELARRLYFLVRQAGLHDVQYRTALLAVRSVDPMVDYLPSTIDSLRKTILKLGLLSESELAAGLTDCRRHLAKPDTSFTLFALAQVWARKG